MKTQFHILCLLFALVMLPCFSWSQPAPDCNAATTLCSPDALNGASGTTPGELPDAGTHCGGSAITGADWWCFLGNGNVVSITISVGNCVDGIGIEAGLFEACGAEVDCFNTPCSGVCQVLSTATVAGRKYCLMVDAWADAKCDYSLAVTGGGAKALESDLMDRDVCAGEEICFSATSENTTVPNINWNLDGTPIGNGEKLIYTVPDNVPDGQVLRLCVSEDICNTEICANLTVHNPPDVELGIEAICHNECFTTPSGAVVCDEGQHEIELMDMMGCLFYERVTIMKYPETEFPEFEIYVCAPSDLARIDNPLGVPGPPLIATLGYNRQDFKDLNSCDFSLEGELKLFELELELDSYCDNNAYYIDLELQMDETIGTIGSITWRQDTASIPQMGQNIVVIEAGEYCAIVQYTVTNEYLGEEYKYSCVKEICTEVGHVISTPLISGDSILCESQIFDLGTVELGGFEYQWKIDGGVILTDSSEYKANIEVVLNDSIGNVKLILLDSCGNTSDTACIRLMYIENEEAYAGEDLSGCNSTFQLEAMGSPGVWTLVGGPGMASVRFADEFDENTQVEVDSFGLYTLQWTTGGQADCSDSSQVQIDYYPELDTLMFLERCVGQDSAIISFFIQSGRGPMTIVEGGGSVVFDSTFNYFIYESGLIEEGFDYSIHLEDKNGCQLFINGNKSCDCKNIAGEMLPDTVQFCGPVNIDASDLYLGGHFKTNIDTTMYVIHEGSGSIIINPQIMSLDGLFSFGPPLEFDRLYFISHVVGPLDVNGELDELAECVQIAPGTPVLWNQPVTADIDGDTSICGLQNFLINGYGGDFEKFWRIDQNLNFQSSDSSAILVPETYGTYDIWYHVRNGLCHDSVLSKVTFWEEPYLDQGVDYDCFFDNADTSFVASFTIAGGRQPYTVLSGGGLINGLTYTSDRISNNDRRSVIVEDANGCSFEIEIQANCVCLKLAGDLFSDTLSTCGSKCIDGQIASNPTTTPEDTTLYVLHDGDRNVLGNILIMSNSPSFCFDKGIMSYDQVYYMAMIVGEKSGNGINFMDPCLSLGKSQPLVFYSIPEALIISNDTINCINLNSTIDGSESNGGALTVLDANWISLTGNQSDIAMPGRWITQVSRGGHYELTVTNRLTGCFSKDTVVVEEETTQPMAEIKFEFNRNLSCRHDSVIVQGEMIDTGTNTAITWLDENGVIIGDENQIVIKSEGDYRYIVLNEVSGCADTIDFLVEEYKNNLGNLIIDYDDPFCDSINSGSIEVLSYSGGYGNVNVYLNGDLISGRKRSGLGAGNYRVIIEDSLGCQLEDTITLMKADLPEGRSLDTLRLNFGESWQRSEVIDFVGPTVVEIEWSDGLSGSIIGPDSMSATGDMIIKVTFIDAQGCSIEDYTFVKVIRPSSNIFVPNSFSPNGDGINDFLVVFGNSNIKSIPKIDIFDRWGELIYTQANMLPEENVWDGRFNDNQVLPGVYVYKIVVELLDGSQVLLLGDITIIQ